MSRNSSVGIEMGRDLNPSRGIIILLSTTPNQPPFQSASGAILQGVKRPGCEADYSHPSSAEGKNGGAISPFLLMFWGQHRCKLAVLSPYYRAKQELATGNRTLLEEPLVVQLVNTFPHFCALEDSSPCLKEPLTSRYILTDESCPQPPMLLLQDPLPYCLSFFAYVSQVVFRFMSFK
jgi:hypothetical protein